MIKIFSLIGSLSVIKPINQDLPKAQGKTATSFLPFLSNKTSKHLSKAFNCISLGVKFTITNFLNHL